MTSHERELILKVADEVRTADRSAVDAEAEQLIRAEVAKQPNAAYLLTQRAIVQGLALEQAKARIDELEARLRRAGLPSSPGGSGGSFLGGAGAPAGAPAPPAGAPAGPAGYPYQGGAPAQAQGQAPAGGSAVGGFLKTAAAAAAGTIGAELIYDGLRHYAGGQGGGLFGGSPRPEAYDSGSRHAPAPRAEESSSDYGSGGDFGSGGGAATQDYGSGGDFGTDAAEEPAEPDEEPQEEEVEEASDDEPEADEGTGGSW